MPREHSYRRKTSAYVGPPSCPLTNCLNELKMKRMKSALQEINRALCINLVLSFMLFCSRLTAV